MQTRIPLSYSKSQIPVKFVLPVNPDPEIQKELSKVSLANQTVDQLKSQFPSWWHYIGINIILFVSFFVLFPVVAVSIGVSIPNNSYSYNNGCYDYPSNSTGGFNITSTPSIGCAPYSSFDYGPWYNWFAAFLSSLIVFPCLIFIMAVLLPILCAIYKQKQTKANISFVNSISQLMINFTSESSGRGVFWNLEVYQPQSKCCNHYLPAVFTLVVTRLGVGQDAIPMQNAYPIKHAYPLQTCYPTQMSAVIYPENYPGNQMSPALAFGQTQVYGPVPFQGPVNGVQYPLNPPSYSKP